ncbi:hypothetical protein [Zavarzinia sp. CC-PAN008]|uniref:hypothetical protein n=1 Tax=Zavarzinia sp. CC-PAN008 TaxID=3243332 RepID=UPI003F74A442
MAKEITDDDLKLLSDYVSQLLSKYITASISVARDKLYGADIYGTPVDETTLPSMRERFEEALKALELARQVAGKE